MAVNPSFHAFIEDQLADFGETTSKKMFGGVGFFRDGKMFGMISGDTFWLKADAHNKAEFEARGMRPFEMKSGKKGMPYWELPADIVEDRDQLIAWATKSYEAAMRAKKK